MQATALSPRSLRLPSRLLRAAPDERLVAALRRGDEKAFEAIYDRHHRALLGFCRHMLGSHEEAEDALQRVFVSAHGHLRDGTAHVNLKPWLYTIARNRCLSMLRARRETLALDDVHEPSCAGLALADEVELGEDLKDMLGDIARLPDDQRAALVLAELGDLSQQEIAATLDVRTDKVKALIFQAREALAGWRQARDAELPRDLRAALDAEGERAAPRPDPPPPRGVPDLHRLRGARSSASAPRSRCCSRWSRASRSSTACSPPRSPPAARAPRRRAARRRGGTAAGASGLGAKALVVAALAVSAGGGGVVAVRELERPRPVERARAATTRARPRPPPWRRLCVTPRRVGLPARRRVRAAAAGDAPRRKQARGKEGRPRPREGPGPRPAAVGRTLRPGPAAGGGARRPRPQRAAAAKPPAPRPEAIRRA